MTVYRYKLTRAFWIAWLCLCGLLSACQPYSKSQLEEHLSDKMRVPAEWEQGTPTGNALAPLPSWAQLIQSEQLDMLIGDTLKNNFELHQKALDLNIARSQLSQSKLQFFPTLDMSLRANRRGTDARVASSANSQASIANSFSLSAELSYELNIWGQVTSKKKAAAYRYASAEAEYRSLQRDTVKSLVSVWASVVENQQLYTLGKVRLKSLNSNLKIIEDGYRSGLNQSLEVYLARNEVARERTRLLTTEQNVLNARRELNLLLGSYPESTRSTRHGFPRLHRYVFAVLPADLLKRHPRLQQAWYAMLQQNQQLAIAHKARFPSFNLGASLSRDNDDFAELIDRGITSWSLGASLLQSVFSAGRLKAGEEQERIRLQKLETSYIQIVYQTFKDIEAAISQHSALEDQEAHTLRALENAVAAEKLSFEQYRRGLVTYTTVLDAQRRAVDAESQLVSIQKQRFVNGVQLHVDLGGSIPGAKDIFDTSYTKSGAAR